MIKKLIALILIALFIPISLANADTPTPVLFLKPLKLQTIVAPIPDGGFSTYTFSVLASNIYNNVDVTYFQLLDCNNLGQDTKRIWWNSFYQSNGDVDARGKTIVVRDLTFNGVAWSRTGVGVCTGNWKMKVTVSMLNKSLNQDIVTITEIPTVFPIKIVEPVTTSWIQAHIEEINKIAEGWKKATEALEAHQKAEAAALILKQQTEAREKAIEKAVAESKAWEALALIERKKEQRISIIESAKHLYENTRCTKQNSTFGYLDIYKFKCVKKGKVLVWKIQN